MAKYYVSFVNSADYYQDIVDNFIIEAISVESILDGFRLKLDALTRDNNTVTMYGLTLDKSAYDFNHYTITAIPLDEWIAENTREE